MRFYFPASLDVPIWSVRIREWRGKGKAHHPKIFLTHALGGFKREPHNESGIKFSQSRIFSHPVYICIHFGCVWRKHATEKFNTTHIIPGVSTNLSRLSEIKFPFPDVGFILVQFKYGVWMCVVKGRRWRWRWKGKITYGSGISTSLHIHTYTYQKSISLSLPQIQDLSHPLQIVLVCIGQLLCGKGGALPSRFKTRLWLNTPFLFFSFSTIYYS
jgi:hypothetical protein